MCTLVQPQIIGPVRGGRPSPRKANKPEERMECDIVWLPSDRISYLSRLLISVLLPTGDASLPMKVVLPTWLAYMQAVTVYPVHPQ